jgi:nitrile hydratase accessory protein
LNPAERVHSQRFESLLREGGDATFAEPWQAQAFALVVHLHSKGAFTWQDWASALSEEIQRAAAHGEHDDGTHYYEHWLAALERLVRERGLAESAALAERKEAWAEAYRRTPHGKPIEL